MNCYLLVPIFTCAITLNNSNISAQDSTQSCKVNLKGLAGTYTGECKNGFAHGKGEAKGTEQYTGNFKFGLPNGKGTYYYNSNWYHTGNFQEGLKEGKGEMHYLRSGMSDSIVKGYWSADIFRGKSYKTYTVVNLPYFDRVEITPTDETGNLLTIETATTSSALKESPLLSGGLILTVVDIVALDGSVIRKIDALTSTYKFSTNYEITKFPVRLQVMLSNGKTFNLELYKAAKWTVLLFLNK